MGMPLALLQFLTRQLTRHGGERHRTQRGLCVGVGGGVMIVRMGVAVVMGVAERDQRQGVAVDEGMAVVMGMRMGMVVAVDGCEGQIMGLAEGLVAAGAVAVAAAGAVLHAAIDALDMM